MIYTISKFNYTSAYKEIFKKKFKLNALKRFRSFPIAVTEKLLDKYLKEKYNITLTNVCYLLILNCKIEESKDTFVITVNDKQLDKFARLITFGTGRLSGSRIIPFMFGKIS